jgi:hypothetical protein
MLAMILRPRSCLSRQKLKGLKMIARYWGVGSIHSDINTGQRLGRGSTRIHTNQTHMGYVDERPIRMNPCESVSHFYQFSDPGPEQP